MKPTTNRKTLLFSCIILNVGVPAWADYSSTVLGLNPLAYYRLNEASTVPAPDTAVNSGTLGPAGNGYYVDSVTHPAAGALVANTADTAASFAGGSVTIPHRPELNVRGPFTTECWAYKDSGSGYPLCAFSSMSTAINRQGWLLYDNDANWQFRIGDTAGYVATAQGGTATVGQWYHLAGVYDGTNAILYVNGVAVATVAQSRPYDPNPSYQTQIGTAANPAFTRNFAGTVDEAAIYTNALSPEEILAHYQNGISASPSQPYNQLVLAQHPVAYYRLNEPAYTPPDPNTFPVATNLGSLVAAANGTYQPGSQTGAAGPPGAGFGAGNTAAAFDGAGGDISLGNPDGLNFTNKISVMAWFKPSTSDGLRNILAHGYISSPNEEIYFRIFNGAYQFGSYESGEGASVNGLAAQDVGNWVFLVGTFDGTNWNIYRYGELIASSPGTAGSGLVDSPWAIGSRGDPTLGDGPFFAGSIDEVAIFNKALSQADIRQILYAGNTPPYIVQQPQAPSGTLIAGAPVSLTVAAVGTPTVGYQWTKEGLFLAGQNAATLHFNNVTTNDAGNYAVIATNAYGSVTSAIVALTITYPAAPAAFVRAVGYPAYDSATKQATLTQVLLEFSGPLAQAGGDPSHYAISDGQNSLTVSGAQFTQNNLGVTLTTSAQTQGKLYTVTVTGVTDGVGNPLANNTAQFTAWVTSPANGLFWEYFDSTEGTAVSILTNNFTFPNQPTLTTNLPVWDTRAVFPDDTHEQYGDRIRGIFVPPVSGNWVFFMRSDDASQGFLNSGGPDEAGKALIMKEDGCCEDWDKIHSDPIPLVAGQPYYLESLHKEGGGGDYVKVAAQLDGTGTPALGTANTVIDPASLAGPMIGYPYAPVDAGGPLTLVGPTDVTNVANHLATFAVQASNPSGLPMFYQWNRNGSPVAGATDSSYSLMTTTADNNAKFTVQVSKIGSVALSSQANLTVTPNTQTPAVVAIHSSKALSTLVVSFSSQMQANPSASSFTITGFTVNSAVLDATGTNIILTLDKLLAPGQLFNLALQNVSDAAGNVLASGTVPGQAAVFSRGLLQFDYFGGLSVSDTSLDNWPANDPRFPNAPEATLFLTGFDSRTVFPDDSHAGYGDHVTGVFVPPTTGNYIFYLKSDDSSALNFNPIGLDPLGAGALATAICCPGFSANASSPQALTGGQMYYIETLHKEGGGGDYVQVGGKLDSDPTDPNALLPLSPAVVGVLADPVGASVTIMEQPASAVLAYLGAGTPRTILNADFGANDGGFTVTNYAAPPSPWAWAAGSWTTFGSSACTGPWACGLRSPVISITNKTAATLTFSHRYSFEFSDKFYDGAQVRMSVNGGPFETVPAGDFLQNGYLGPMQGTVLPAILSSPGFSNTMFRGESPNFSVPAMLTTVASLGSFNAGDQIQLEFLGCWDECSEGQEPNWEIKNAQVTVGEALPVVANFSVGAESTYQGMPNPYLAYFWQKDTGSGFADVPNANSADYTFNASMADSGSHYRCLVYSPGSSATSAVATLTVTLAITVAQTSPSTLQLSWPLPPPPLTASSFVLEQTPTLSPATWTATPGQPQTTGTTVFMSVPITQTGPGLLYRLRKN